MKIRRFWPIQWSPDQTESFLTWKMVSHIPNIHLGTYKNYQKFHSLIFYGYSRLRGVGADLPRPGWYRVNLLFWGKFVFFLQICRHNAPISVLYILLLSNCCGLINCSPEVSIFSRPVFSGTTRRRTDFFLARSTKTVIGKWNLPTIYFRTLNFRYRKAGACR